MNKSAIAQHAWQEQQAPHQQASSDDPGLQPVSPFQIDPKIVACPPAARFYG